MCHKMTSLEGFITALDFIQNQHTKYVKKRKNKGQTLKDSSKSSILVARGCLSRRSTAMTNLIQSPCLRVKSPTWNKMIIYKGISIFLNMHVINDLITWSVSPNWTSFSDLSWPRYLTRPLRASPSATARKLRSMGWKKRNKISYSSYFNYSKSKRVI